MNYSPRNQIRINTILWRKVEVGEIQPANNIHQRIAEADKLGFDDIYISKFQQPQVPAKTRIRIHAMGRLDEVIRKAIGVRG